MTGLVDKTKVIDRVCPDFREPFSIVSREILIAKLVMYPDHADREVG